MATQDNDDNTTVIASITARCIICGYDLRAIARDSNCPECGTPVARSLSGYGLSMAHPKWLRRLVIGQTLLTCGVLTCVAIIAISCLVLITGALAPRAGGRTAAGEALILVPVAALAVVSLIGLWLVCTPEPRVVGQERLLSVRRLTRAAVVAGLLMVVAWMTVLFNVFTLQFNDLGMLAIATIVVFTLTLLPALKWFNALAIRIPDGDLQRATEHLFKFMRVAIPIMLVGAAGVAVQWRFPSGAAEHVTCFILFLTVGIVIVGIVYALFVPWMLLRFLRQFGACHGYALASDAEQRNESS